MKVILTYILFLLVVPGTTKAWHIIGGEIYYTCIGNNTYKITLKIYRDCNSTTPFDNPAVIGIYNNSFLVHNLYVNFPGAAQIQPDLTNPCLQIPAGVCVEEGVYETTVLLPNVAGGYDIVYQRCCRNSTIVNLYDPASTGLTLTTHIPDNSSASCNSSPRFSNYPPIVICAGTPLVFDHSATDPDNDMLVYELCTPNQGADPGSPQPDPPPPPPYDPVFWQPPYNTGNQIGGAPPMAIDPVTGLLTANPANVGQYVVGVCVKEYRNGILLSQNVRDFQFNVTICDPLIEAQFTSSLATATKGDTLLFCGTLNVNFNNYSYGSNDYEWDFGVPGISTDYSTQFNPSYTYPDYGIYQVRLIAAPGIACGDTTYNYVELRKGVNANFGFQNQCVNISVPFTDQSIPLDGVLTNWQWTFGDGAASSQQNPLHAYSSPGNYDVTLTSKNSYGCSETITKTVTIYDLPDIDARPDTFICDVDEVTLHAHDGVSFLWQPNYNISDVNVAQPIVSPDITTTYVVTVTNSTGCVSSDSVTIQVTDTVIASVNPDITICEGELAQLWAQNAVYYHWEPEDFLNDAFIANPVSKPSYSITYYVNSFIGSCYDQDTVVITVLPKPDADAGADVTINQGESVQLNATGGVSYSWNPPDALSDPAVSDPYAFPLNTITYYVTVAGSNGCKEIDSITVNVTHFHLIIAPNAFTPNGDGINDHFNFFTKGIRQITSVKIFNRWGEMLYHSNGEEQGWNGTYREIPCEMETYVFVIDGITYDNEVIQEKGALTIIR